MDDIEDVSDVMPSAMPSEAEIAAWEALPKAEQLRRLKMALADPECSVITADTVESILDEARRRWEDREGNG